MHGRPRRTAALLVALVAAAALPLGAAAAADAAVVSATSTNWSGYAARRTGVTFRTVAGTWVVPRVDCSDGRARSSASWIGIGGYAAGAQGLEQLGTESDCSSSGRASYSAWFEVLPDLSITAPLTVHAGDVVSASAQLSGHAVRMRLTNTTRGTSVTRTLHAAVVDRTSAEWIVEAPAICDGTRASGGGCSQTALANFGTTGFSHASATTTGGHTGAIRDAAWSAVKISLRVKGGGSGGPGRSAGVPGGPGAVPSVLSPAGSAFDVQWTAAG